MFQIQVTGITKTLTLESENLTRLKHLAFLAEIISSHPLIKALFKNGYLMLL